MKKLLFICTLFFFSSCEKADEERQNFNLDTNLKFTVVSKEGEDLLDPANPNGISENEIKIYYLVDGVKKEIYDNNLDYPRSFRIYKDLADEFRLVLFPNYSEDMDRPVTYIQWNEQDIDTVEVSYDRYPDAIRTSKVWLNGDLILDRSNNLNEEPIFSLVKNY